MKILTIYIVCFSFTYLKAHSNDFKVLIEAAQSKLKPNEILSLKNQIQKKSQCEYEIKNSLVPITCYKIKEYSTEWLDKLCKKNFDKLKLYQIKGLSIVSANCKSFLKDKVSELNYINENELL